MWGEGSRIPNVKWASWINSDGQAKSHGKARRGGTLSASSVWWVARPTGHMAASQSDCSAPSGMSPIHSVSVSWQVPGPFLTPLPIDPSLPLPCASPDINISAFSMVRHRRANTRLYFRPVKFPSFVPDRCIASFRYWGPKIEHNLQYSFLQASGC